MIQAPSICGAAGIWPTSCPGPTASRCRPLLACAATDEGEEFTAATEANQIRYIEKFNQQRHPP